MGIRGPPIEDFGLKKIAENKSVMSEVLCNRLRCALPSIVDMSQSTFVSGRLITIYNAIVDFEGFHSMFINKVGSFNYMGLKLDMRKAYDRIE